MIYLKYSSTRHYWASQVALMVKNSPAHAGDAGDMGLIPRLGRSPGRGNGPTLVFLPESSHGQSRLAGCHPWGCRESDTTERLSRAHRRRCCQVASVVSGSVQPQGRQPASLLCPQDSRGKNTGVGCHFLLQHSTLDASNIFAFS